MTTKKIILGGIFGAAALFSTMSFANYGPGPGYGAWPRHAPMQQQNYHQHPNAMGGRYYPFAPRQRVIIVNRGPYYPHYGMHRHRPLFEFHFGR